MLSILIAAGAFFTVHMVSLLNLHGVTMLLSVKVVKGQEPY